MKELRYLHALVQRPGVELTALELSALVAGHGTTVAEADVEELDEARSWADTGRIERIEAEREALLLEVAGASRIRTRRSTGCSEEHCVTVTPDSPHPLRRYPTNLFDVFSGCGHSSAAERVAAGFPSLRGTSRALGPSARAGAQ
jgi:hypothetical protein